MSEKSEQTKKKLAQNADKITIGVLAAILLVMGYFYFQEQNSGLGAAPTDGKPANLQDTLAESPILEMLQTMTAAPSIANDPEAQRVAQWSMFDGSAAQEERAVEEQAKQQLANARTLVAQNQAEQARPLLEQVLKDARYLKEANELLDQITTAPETAAPAGEVPPTY